MVLALLHRVLGELSRSGELRGRRPASPTTYTEPDGSAVDRDGRSRQPARCRRATHRGRRHDPSRRLLADNLQDFTERDVEVLLGLGLTDVVDLRSDYEIEVEGPNRLTDQARCGYTHSMFREWREGVGKEKPDDVRPEVLPAEALPWVDLEAALTSTTTWPPLTSPISSTARTPYWPRYGPSVKQPVPSWCTVPPARTAQAPSSRWRCCSPAPNGTP